MKEVILIDQRSSSELHFDQGGEVVVYDQTEAFDPISRKIIISNYTKLRWYSVAHGRSHYSLQFITESGESIVRMLLLASQDEQLKMNVHSTLSHSDTITNIHILSLAGDSGIIELDGSVQIDSNIAKVKGHILEENIFLGSKGNIRGIPSLFVHSDDVEAGHAARIERVSDEKLYYLRSRGIPKDDATVMMIESSVAGLFEGLDEKYQEIIRKKVTQLF
jgi:Fe-S cluster assembly scaffold protein SufB